MEARKLINKKKDAEYEIQTWHVITPEIDEQKLRDVCDTWDDCEELFMRGVAMSFSEDYLYVEADKLIESIEEIIEDVKDDDEEPNEDMVEILNSLKKYKGYTIWF